MKKTPQQIIKELRKKTREQNEVIGNHIRSASEMITEAEDLKKALHRADKDAVINHRLLTALRCNESNLRADVSQLESQIEFLNKVIASQACEKFNLGNSI